MDPVVPVDPWILSIIAAALAGLLVGMNLGFLLARRAQDRSLHRHRHVERHARRLAARWSVTRNSRSLVAAFRALSAEPPDSPRYPLRRREAQRARAAWCRAIDTFQSAEAERLAWSAMRPRHAKSATPVAPVGADALRVAIEGSAADVQRFVTQLDQADRAVLEELQQELTGPPTRGGRVTRAAADLLSLLRAIARRWADRP